MSERGNLARGIVAGVGAGLIAAFVMNEFQALWQASVKSSSGDDGAPATLKAADRISKAVADQPVPKAAETAASDTVHYATGAALGAFYGIAAEFATGITAGCGAGYAGAVWAALDNGVLPALRLSPPPGKTKPKDHLYAFLSHLVFGWAMELSRRVFATIL
jgi:hypothetical protein